MATPVTLYTACNSLYVNQYISLEPISLYSTRTQNYWRWVLNAKDSTFVLPNTKNTTMLVSLALGDANFLRRPCTFHFFV